MYAQLTNGDIVALYNRPQPSIEGLEKVEDDDPRVIAFQTRADAFRGFELVGHTFPADAASHVVARHGSDDDSPAVFVVDGDVVEVARDSGGVASLEVAADAPGAITIGAAGHSPVTVVATEVE